MYSTVCVREVLAVRRRTCAAPLATWPIASALRAPRRHSRQRSTRSPWDSARGGGRREGARVPARRSDRPCGRPLAIRQHRALNNPNPPRASSSIPNVRVFLDPRRSHSPVHFLPLFRCVPLQRVIGRSSVCQLDLWAVSARATAARPSPSDPPPPASRVWSQLTAGPPNGAFLLLL